MTNYCIFGIKDAALGKASSESDEFFVQLTSDQLEDFIINVIQQELEV